MKKKIDLVTIRFPSCGRKTYSLVWKENILFVKEVIGIPCPIMAFAKGLRETINFEFPL